MLLKYDQKKLGKLLQIARKEASMTQAEVSKRLGYGSSQFVSNIERGVSVAPLKALALMTAMYKLKPEQVAKVILESQRQFLKAKLLRDA